MVPRKLGGKKIALPALSRKAFRASARARGDKSVKSSSVMEVRDKGFGAKGNGWVAQACSPGTLERGTARSSIRNNDSPVSRFKTKRNPCFVACTTTSTRSSPRTTVASVGGQGRS
jgi:hypothetical protein